MNAAQGVLLCDAFEGTDEFSVIFTSVADSAHAHDYVSRNEFKENALLHQKFFQFVSINVIC